MDSRSRLRLSSQALVVVAVVVVVGTLVLLVSMISPTPEVEESAYGYSVTLDTNATLRNVTLYYPLPSRENGSSPIADSIRERNVGAPDSWQYDVVETDRGLMVGIEAEAVTAELRADGHHYSTYQFGLTVPADHVIDTGDPYGREPTIAPVDGRHVRPCPNVAEPDPDQTCFDYEAHLYVSYDTPPGTEVGIRLVHNAVNSYEPPRADVDMYYERLFVSLHGPQDGWVVVDGFATVEEPP